MATLTLAICARNAQDCIGKCLDSIAAQTVAPDEVIVAVDDLSDPTVAAVEGFGAKIIASHATGLYEARNSVLDACTTEYLAFTDADCILTPQWVERVKQVLQSHPDVAAGTGRHPPVGPRNLASWLHHMWFVVETAPTGYYTDVIGGNSYFRTEALRQIGGWLKLPHHSAAEDMYVSRALRKAGHRIWFEEAAAVEHAYESSLASLWRKSVMMGKDIVVMLRAAGWFEGLWWYTLGIPMLAAVVLLGIVLLVVDLRAGLAVMTMPLIGSLAWLTFRFRSFRLALPRWIARWIVIWPYSWGVLKGLTAPIPKEALSSRRPEREEN